jgi:hypothetical protein
MQSAMAMAAIGGRDLIATPSVPSSSSTSSSSSSPTKSSIPVYRSIPEFTTVNLGFEHCRLHGATPFVVRAAMEFRTLQNDEMVDEEKKGNVYVTDDSIRKRLVFESVVHGYNASGMAVLPELSYS